MVRAPDLIGDRANSKVQAGWHIARGCACARNPSTLFTRLAGVREGGRRGSRFVIGVSVGTATWRPLCHHLARRPRRRMFVPSVHRPEPATPAVTITSPRDVGFTCGLIETCG